jgi:tetratricopeptide (TPR) repeat protein
MRGGLRIGEHDKTGSDDLDAVAILVSKESDLRLPLAILYVAAEKFEAAIGQYDLWIPNHSGDGRAFQAFNGRCWARAAAGRDLNKALDDCNRAVSLNPKVAAILDSRGLVELRLGDNDKAIADYNAALALQPKLSWSLYGRGLAEMRKGQKTEGAADEAAAAAIDPKLPNLAKSYGIVGPDGA